MLSKWILVCEVPKTKKDPRTHIESLFTLAKESGAHIVLEQIIVSDAFAIDESDGLGFAFL